MQMAWEGLFSPNGQEVLAVGWGLSGYRLRDNGMRTAGTAVNVEGGPRYLHGAAYDATGDFLYTGNDQGVVEKWDMSKKAVVQRYEGHTGACKRIVVSADGKRLITASPRDPLLRIWDEESGKQLGVLEGHESGVGSLALMPDGKHLISGSCWRSLTGPMDGASPEHCIRIWNIEARKQVARLDGHAALVTDLAISPDGKTLVSTSLDKVIHLWDLSALELED